MFEFNDDECLDKLHKQLGLKYSQVLHFLQKITLSQQKQRLLVKQLMR